MRNILVLDISLIGCIIENECIVLNGIVYPLSQFVACNHRSRGVIGITQIDNIHPLVGQCRSEIILGGTRHVSHVAPFAVLTQLSRTSYHHVRVDIHRIDRVGYSNTVIPSHQFLEITGITLGTVINEYLTCLKMNAACNEIVLYDSITQKLITLLRTISSE